MNGKTLHLEAHDMKSHSDDTEIAVSRVLRTKVKAEKSGSEWVVVDVKDIVQLWFNKTSQQYKSSNATDSDIRTIEISCLDCEPEAGHLISSRGRLRPFLVIDLDKQRTLNRRKRSLECKGKAVECCLRSLYVNFTKIGWDWILYPEGFYANFCDGECNRRIYPLNNGYVYMLQEIKKKNMAQTFKICCSPTKMSGLSLLYFDRDEMVIKGDVPNMRVDSCGC